jgi:prepilin-type N-terminal cleavage/methylation domain-containing protein
MKLQRGFSLVELLVVITIIGILAAIAIPNMTKVRNKAHESEVKANLHVIQEAIHRYDVDEHEFPKWLIGGDQNSWDVYYLRMGYDRVNPPIYDPLIHFNYIDTYPLNPFTGADAGGLYLEWSGGEKTTPASGDPRFGMKGTVMNNSVDDPVLSWTGSGGVAETINTAGPYVIQNYLVYGGRMALSGNPDRYTIQGSFFYRAEGPIDMLTSNVGSGNPTRRDFLYQGYDRYILGGFGHETTKGLDVIRLEGAGNYRHMPDTDNFPWDIPLLVPEVFGGGDNENNPYFPYEPSQDGQKFYYGAPDGLEDGVVIVLTDSGGDNMEF